MKSRNITLGIVAGIAMTLGVGNMGAESSKLEPLLKNEVVQQKRSNKQIDVLSLKFKPYSQSHKQIEFDREAEGRSIVESRYSFRDEYENKIWNDLTTFYIQGGHKYTPM